MNNDALLNYIYELIGLSLKEKEGEGEGEEKGDDEMKGGKGKGHGEKEGGMEKSLKVTFGTIKKSFHNDEQMIATDVVYAPFELDAHGEWMSDETIKKACDSFNKLWDEGKVKMNLFHLQNTDKIKLLKSYVLDEDTTYGDQVIKKGTWVAEYKFLDDNLWKLKKAGVIGGLSICGGCHRIEPETDGE